jgi:hypothetical protein
MHSPIVVHSRNPPYLPSKRWRCCLLHPAHSLFLYSEIRLLYSSVQPSSRSWLRWPGL